MIVILGVRAPILRPGSRQILKRKAIKKLAKLASPKNGVFITGMGPQKSSVSGSLTLEMTSDDNGSRSPCSIPTSQRPSISCVLARGAMSGGQERV